MAFDHPQRRRDSAGRRPAGRPPVTRARPPRRLSIGVLVIWPVLLCGLTLAWTTDQARQQDHQWCALFGALDHGPAPATPAGLKIEQALLARGRSLGC